MGIKKSKKRKKALSFNKIIIALAVLAFSALFIAKAPIFNISNIVINGNIVVEEDEIKGLLGFNNKSKNIFLLSKSGAEKALKRDAYIKSASITKKLPNTISIEIEERTARCYVEYKNMSLFLLVDEDGMVLDVHSYMRENYPVIVGVEFVSFNVGKYLDASENFDEVIMISVMFSKYGLDELLKIDCSDSKDIHLYVRNVDITFGSIDDGDEKVRILKAVFESEKFPHDARGFLDISDITKNPVFTYLK